MPNWCLNHLEICGPKDAVRGFINGLDSDEDCSMLLRYAPVPVSMENDIDYTSKWWGTKWPDSNVAIPFDNDSCWTNVSKAGHIAVPVSFETPWGPPIEGFSKIAKWWSNLGFTLSYCEEGLGFMGVATFINGQLNCQYDVDAPNFLPTFVMEADDNLYVEMSSESAWESIGSLFTIASRSVRIAVEIYHDMLRTSAGSQLSQDSAKITGS